MIPSSSQIRFTSQLCLGISKCSTTSRHLRLLYSSGRVPQAKQRWGLTLACAAQETPGPVHPVDSYRPRRSTAPHPAQLILHRGWRLVVSGHSQSLQLTGLGKFLPLICQQQPRLNYKRTVYSAHIKGTPQVPSLGDKGGCATGPYRTSATLGHTTKIRSQSNSTQHIETNIGGCQKEETKEHGPNEKIDQNSRKRAKGNGNKQSIRCRDQNTL